MPDLINFNLLRLLVRSYYDIQKLRIAYDLRLQDLDRRKILFKQDAEQHYGVSYNHLETAEKELNKSVKNILAGHPVAEYCQSIRGIGPTLTGAFMAEVGSDREAQVRIPPRWAKVYAVEHSEEKWITHPLRMKKPKKRRSPESEDDEQQPAEDEDPAGERLPYHDLIFKLFEHDELTILNERKGIACFPKVTRLWAYAGLGVIPDPENPGACKAPKRQKGKRHNWNPFLKTLAFKCSDSWIKTGGKFRGIYDSEKAAQLARVPAVPKWLADKRARRKAAKIFYSMAWEVWRRSEGLDVPPFYAVTKLGHEALHPEDFVE